jgi:broad specificity phosphatase PhoE
MTLFRPLAALLLFVAAGCASAPNAPAAPSVYVLRHLQKADGPDPALSAEGRENAIRLSSLLDDRKPRAIYVSTTRRARETAAPLAAKLKLAIKEYDPGDTPGLIARVMAEPGPVVVVGHSNTVPDIVAALGGERPAPLAETDFGDVWHVRPDGTVERLRVD